MKELVLYFCLEWNWGTNSCVCGTVQPLDLSNFHSNRGEEREDQIRERSQAAAAEGTKPAKPYIFRFV